jgi:glycosyltransferase involved in cell wall biosynthesis
MTAIPDQRTAAGSAGPAGRALNLLLMDGNAPWVRSPFAAMPAGVTVHAFRTRGPAAARHPFALLRGWRWRQTNRRWWEQVVLMPSWSKAPRLTSAVCGFHLGRRLATLTDDAVVVFTLPHYSRLAGRWPSVPCVYFAYDPYQCYAGWDAAAMAAGEKGLLARCDAIFAVSPALADDFRKLTDRPVFVQPNGVSDAFLAAFDGPPSPPADLPTSGPPVIGCVGQISRAYDWDLLKELVRFCPEMQFVFVGPRFDEGPDERSRIDHVFAAPNVRWLGPKPHTDLPRYIRRFDVCLNPLRVEPCNDRRSLLRLYDYLASDRPIVSTAIASALNHRPHVEVGRDIGELASLLRRLTAADGSAVDIVARRAYIRQHTWERRAELFLANLRSAVGRPMVTR